MRFLIIGTGAIGGYVGASLGLAGEDVSFLERPEGVEFLREHGLKLTLQGQSRRLKPLKVYSSLGEALQNGPYHSIILAVKSYDTASVIEQMRPFQDQIALVLSLQNGVDNESRLEGLLGPARVIAGTVTSSISKPGQGEVLVERSRGVGIDRGHGSSISLAAAFEAAGIPAKLYPHAESMKWSKMLTNLPANATAAILNMKPVEIFANPDLFRLEMTMMREALHVMRAFDFKVVDLPGVPVRALAIAFSRLPAGAARLVLQRGLGAGRGGKMPSFHIDLHSGRNRSEVDDLNGAVVRYGAKRGISTPVNEVLTKVLLRLAAGEEDRYEYAGQTSKLLRLVGL